MVTHFSGMIPHGYTLLWYDTINTCVTHFSGMIPLTHGVHTSLVCINTHMCYTLLWYDTINTYVTHFSGMIPLTHVLHTSLVSYTEKCVTLTHQRSV